jgi:hypothetical protein
VMLAMWQYLLSCSVSLPAPGGLFRLEDDPAIRTLKSKRVEHSCCHRCSSTMTLWPGGEDEAVAVVLLESRFVTSLQGVVLISVDRKRVIARKRSFSSPEDQEVA